MQQYVHVEVLTDSKGYKAYKDDGYLQDYGEPTLNKAMRE
jgi:hypothetical protein